MKEFHVFAKYLRKRAAVEEHKIVSECCRYLSLDLYVRYSTAVYTVVTVIARVGVEVVRIISLPIVVSHYCLLLH